MVEYYLNLKDGKFVLEKPKTVLKTAVKWCHCFNVTIFFIASFFFMNQTQLSFLIISGTFAKTIKNKVIPNYFLFEQKTFVK